MLHQEAVLLNLQEDAAPEIYETPELADDVSTAQVSTKKICALESLDSFRWLIRD